MYLTKRGIARKLAEWKQELGIEWDIEVRVVRADKLKGNHGLVRMTEEKRMALILLLDPVDAPVDEMRPYDMEITLVHELVHVMLAPFNGKPHDHKDIVSEQCVHSVSSAMVRMRRAARRRKR